MHKYQPRFHVILIEPEFELQGHQVENITPEIMRENMRTFVFPETQFMAVTAYQNHMVRMDEIRHVIVYIGVEKKFRNLLLFFYIQQTGIIIFYLVILTFYQINQRSLTTGVITNSV